MYQPEEKMLEKYADVLVNFALGDKEGIKKGDVVLIQCPEVAKPLYAALSRAVTNSGGHIIGNYHPNVDDEHNIKRDFYKNADKHQINHFPDKYFRGLIDEIDHKVTIIAETDKQSLKDVDSKKIMKRGEALKPFTDWQFEKEGRGEFTWTIAAYATQSMADEAGLSLKEYWREIIKACYLDVDDPVVEWRKIYEKIDEITEALNKMKIDTMHVEAEDIDLKIKLGEKRKWQGGGGSNIPSYEIYTSPDWRGVEGKISFNEPLYRYGNLIKGVSLEFEGGKVVKASAEKNEEVLKEMINTEGADKIGEFSLTDHRFSRISKFMAETLFDENTGAEHGNTHIALGFAYKDCFDGNANELEDEEWKELGFNDSSVHTDMVSTKPRTVTATLQDGSKKIIYKDGEFQI